MFWPFTRRRKARAASSGRFGPYTILRTIHEGEKALVHLARSEETTEEVVIKVYNPRFDRQAKRLRKKYGLRREGSVGLALNAPEGVDPAAYPLVRTIAYGRENGRKDGAPYVVMEYVNGPSLKTLIATQDPMLTERRLAVCIQAALALEIVHKSGFVHRDVCSDNFLFTSDGQLKLIDLGFCAPIGLRFEEKTGTISYMSPEQAQVEPLTPRTDVYGLGIVMYEIFTGRLPFTSPHKGDDPQTFHRRATEIISKHVHDAPPKPSELAPSLDPRIEAAILKCLEKRPANRYGTMRELIRDLSAAAE